MAGYPNLTDAQFEFLQSSQGQSALAGDVLADPLAAVKQLRKTLSAEQAAAVLTTKQVRSKAKSKFPEPLAGELYGTDTLLQQASSWRMARWAAIRMKQLLGPASVVDLCCGLGADALAMAREGLRVHCIDLSDTALRCAAANGAGEPMTFEQGRAEEITIASDAIVHIDPDRRATGKRVVKLADCSPGEGFLRHMVGQTAGGCIKLSPATDAGVLDDWPGVRWAYISEGRTCRQLLVCWGVLAEMFALDGYSGEPGEGCAIVLSGEMESPVAEILHATRKRQPRVPLDGLGFLIEPDPAVHAASAVDALAAKCNAARIHPKLDWLIAPAPATTTLARNWQIIDECKGKLKDVQATLAKHNAGTVLVKPRGVRLDTDRLQKKLAGKGDQTLAVFWTQIDYKQRAYICR